MRRWIARISRIASSRRLASIADMARSLIPSDGAPWSGDRGAAAGRILEAGPAAGACQGIHARGRDGVELLTRTRTRTRTRGGLGDVDDVQDVGTAEAGDLHGTHGCEGGACSLGPLWPTDDALPSSGPAEDFGALGPSIVRSVVDVRPVPAAAVMAGPAGKR
jgi:hypothetical protein